MPRRARAARATAAAVGVVLAVAGCAAAGTPAASPSAAASPSPGASAPGSAPPNGASPDGATPDGATPDGATPDGPDGATPDGPDGATPDSSTQGGSDGPGGPSGSTLDSSTPGDGSTPRGSAPRGPGGTAAPPSARRPLVVLDPGHNGGNAAHPEEIGRLVDAGNGRRKRCNEVGSATAAGYPEHAFTWDVSVRMRAVLVARGVDVRLTRPDDRGVGPCVDVRGRFGTALRADAVVSVHADGAVAAGSGFHVIEAARSPTRPANRRLALAVRASLRSGSGLRPANYVAGGDALDVRDDLAGLNLATRPSVLVECGNMRNPADAALLASPAGRARIATALAAGVLAYLDR